MCHLLSLLSTDDIVLVIKSPGDGEQDGVPSIHHILGLSSYHVPDDPLGNWIGHQAFLGIARLPIRNEYWVPRSMH